MRGFSDDEALKRVTWLERLNKGDNVLIIGEYVTSRSLADYLEKSKGVNAVVFAMTETAPRLLRKNENGEASDKILNGEDELIRELKALESEGLIDKVIADPFFKVICPESAEFISVPHRAFSGRIFDNVKTCNLW